YVEQAHLPKFEVDEAVPIAKTARMSKARLGKEGDQRRLRGAATGAQYAQLLPRPALRPQLNARKSGVAGQRPPFLQECFGVINRRRIAVRLVLLPDRLGNCVFHDTTLVRTDRASNIPIRRTEDRAVAEDFDAARAQSTLPSGITPPSAAVSSAATSRTVWPSCGSRSSVRRLVMPETEMAASGSAQLS